MKNALILSAALGIVCMSASAVLAVAHAKTKAAVDAAEKEGKSKALYQVLPEFTNDPLAEGRTVDYDGHVVTFYQARDAQGELLAFAGQGTTDKGFGGTVEIMVGIDLNGKIRKIVVTKHQETPGLGTVATDRKAVRTLADLFADKGDTEADPNALPPCRYLDSYEGFAMTPGASFQVDKDGGDIQAVSGATISSRAVADAVSTVAGAFTAYRAELDGE